MKTRKLFRVTALMLALFMLFTASMQTTMAYIVTKTDSIINIFLPFKGLVSDLILNKEVEHPFGDDYVYPDNISFDFLVELGDFYANTKIETTNGVVTADENGSFVVAVKPGEPVGIENIDEGTPVKVSEITDNMGKGFSAKNDTPYESLIPASGSLVVSITNVYSPEKIKADLVDLTGVKQLEGRDWQDGDSFTFVLEMKGGDGKWTEVGQQTVTYDAENKEFDKFSFSDMIHALEFEAAGTYSFRIYELEGDLDEIDYDKSVNHFNIVVADPDMDGTLDIVDIVVAQNITLEKNDETGVFSLKVVFNNTFVPEAKPIPEDIKVGVSVDKTVNNKGEDEIGPEGFRFILENAESGEQIFLVSDEEGAAAVELNLSAEYIDKTISYMLYEKNEGKAHVTYSTKVYEIEITVKHNELDNVLVAELKVDGKDADSIVGAFENIYDYTPPKAPATNDNMAMPLTMFVISAVIMVGLVITRKKKAGFFD